MASTNLKYHKQAVHDKIKVKCDKCNKEFARKSKLRYHTRIVHEGFVPYECKDCGKTFNRSEYYKTHVLMVHKGINPYVCELCNKVFTQAHMLRTHLKNKTCVKS